MGKYQNQILLACKAVIKKKERIFENKQGWIIEGTLLITEQRSKPNIVVMRSTSSVKLLWKYSLMTVRINSEKLEDFEAERIVC